MMKKWRFERQQLKAKNFTLKEAPLSPSTFGLYKLYCGWN